jgi:hypothetical protein
MRTNPSLYQIDARSWLYRCSEAAGRQLHLDEIPDLDLDRLRDRAFDWIWLLGVWQTCAAAAAASRKMADEQHYRQSLPDFSDEDITGSRFAVCSYDVHVDFGGPEALRKLRERLRARGICLMLDFAPNHTAVDHEWVHGHPDFYVSGSASDLARKPSDYFEAQTNSGRKILAHGRDPYFPGWIDTAQLNYGNPAVQSMMKKGLQRVAALCDGVRCDMAMLLLPDVFQKTWGIEIQPFWSDAIAGARQVNPKFVLMAEVYWNRERQLQELGFDYTYDKNLYDDLIQGKADAARDHLTGDIVYQHKSARFLENHDEKRVAAVLPRAMHEAAAIVSYFVPGLRFFHDGQLEGYRIKPNIHLRRQAIEPVDADIAQFYSRLLDCLKGDFAQGGWSLLETLPAWDGNPTQHNFLCFAWTGEGCPRHLIAVNFAPCQSQCYVKLPFETLDGKAVALRDEMGAETYMRDGTELNSRGLYLDLPPWRYNVFEIQTK